MPSGVTPVYAMLPGKSEFAGKIMDFKIDYPRLSVRDARERAGEIWSVRGIPPTIFGCRDGKEGFKPLNLW